MGYHLFHFQPVKVKTYGRNYIYWDSLPNYLVRWITLDSYWSFAQAGSLFEGRRQMQTFLRDPRKYFACSQKSIGVRIRSLCNNNRECCSVFLKRSPILMISPICFHLNRWKNGKCNCSPEEHLQNPKTNSGSYLQVNLKLYIFVNKIELMNSDPLIFRFHLLNICIWVDLWKPAELFICLFRMYGWSKIRHFLIIVLILRQNWAPTVKGLLLTYDMYDSKLSLYVMGLHEPQACSSLW